ITCLPAAAWDGILAVAMKLPFWLVLTLPRLWLASQVIAARATGVNPVPISFTEPPGAIEPRTRMAAVSLLGTARPAWAGSIGARSAGTRRTSGMVASQSRSRRGLIGDGDRRPGAGASGIQRWPSQ